VHVAGPIVLPDEAGRAPTGVAPIVDDAGDGQPALDEEERQLCLD